MEPSVVVVVDPGAEALGAFVGGFLEGRVGPFPQNGPDEAFGLAVGPGPVGPGEAVLEPPAVAHVGEAMGAVAAAVVGEEAAGADAEFAEGREGADLLDAFVGGPCRRTPWPGGPAEESLVAEVPLAGEPLAEGSEADARPAHDRRGGLALHPALPDEEGSTSGGGPCVAMDVHPGSPSAAVSSSTHSIPGLAWVNNLLRARNQPAVSEHPG